MTDVLTVGLVTVHWKCELQRLHHARWCRDAWSE